MSNSASLYWLTRLDNIQVLFLILFLLCVGVAIFVIAALGSDPYEEEEKALRKVGNWLIGISSFSLMVLTFLPDKNDMIFIVAGGKTLDFIESDTSLNKIPCQTTKIISDFLEKQIKELDEK